MDAGGKKEMGPAGSLAIPPLTRKVEEMATQTRTEPTLGPADLAARAIQRRAVEAAIWGMPVVNCDLMQHEMLTKTAGAVNQFVYWGRPLDWRNQTLTPNPDTLYFMAFYNTQEVGPIVVEIPPG